MANRILTAAIAMTLCGVVLADYIKDREAAVEMVKAGKHEEALAAFLAMAAGEVSDYQRSDALEQAVECAMRLKQYEEAMDLAERIPLEPCSKASRMGVLMGQRKWKGVVETFGGEDIATWPDREAGKAFRLRGQAYASLKDGKAAEADLTSALNHVASGYDRARVWLDLGNNYRGTLKDTQQALKAYGKAIERLRGQGSWINLSAVAAAADILTRQQKYAEAFEVLGTVDADRMQGYWRGTLLAAHGEVYAAQGKTKEAVARYSQAAQVEDAPDSRKQAWRKRLAELRGDGQ